MTTYVYLFFYGSVVNSHSRNFTLKTKTKGIPVLFNDINYKLSYNFNSSKSASFTVLGLVKSKRKYTIPGILVKVNKTQLEYIKRREKSYTFTPIEHSPELMDSSIPFNTRLPIFTFTKDHIEHNHVHTNYYLDLTISGFLEYGDSFTRLFFKYCHGLPLHLNTLSKWKRDLKKRIIEYTSVLHYAKDDKLLSTLQSIL